MRPASSPEPDYTFTHALTQEVAYGSLLHEWRRAIHAQIVDALERHASDGLLEQVEQLAHHAFLGERGTRLSPTLGRLPTTPWGARPTAR